MTHVANWKKSRVNALTDMISGSPVISIIDIEGIPASQLQKIRKTLPVESNFLVTKNTFLRIALKRASKEKTEIDQLTNSLDGQRGIVTSEMNPFKLFRAMEATMMKAPAKGGEVCPEDIEIKAGDTPFKPGPIVGELQKAGFPAAIEKGKVVIKKDKIMVKEGDRIPKDVAKMLTRLEIYPMTVGLNLVASFENEKVYLRDVLDVDVQAYMDNMQLASSGAFNLSMFVHYPTKVTISHMVMNAYQNAFNLSMNAQIPTPQTISQLLTKAAGMALSLSSHLPDLSAKDETKKDPETKKESKEEPKTESKEEKGSKDTKEENPPSE